MSKRKNLDSNDVADAFQSLSKNFAVLADLFKSPEFADKFASTRLNGTKNKKARNTSIKDPNAPPRNLTSYIHFTNAVRNKVVEENPDTSPRDIARILGDMWRNLPEKQKQKYNKIAKTDKLRYDSAMEEYKQKSPSESSSSSSTSPTKKTTSAPSSQPKVVNEEQEDDEEENDEISSKTGTLKEAEEENDEIEETSGASAESNGSNSSDSDSDSDNDSDTSASSSSSSDED